MQFIFLNLYTKIHILFRFNGILGSYHTNNHSIPEQIMRKFVTCAKLNAFIDESANVSNKVEFNTIEQLHKCLQTNSIDFTCLSFLCEKGLGQTKTITFDEESVSQLIEMFHTYCNLPDVSRVSYVGKSNLRLQIGNQIVSTKGYKGSSPYSFVSARWRNKDNSFVFRPAVVVNLFEIKYINNDESTCCFWVAEVQWFREHEKKNFYGFNSPTKIWCTTFERTACNRLIPARFIKNRIICCKEHVKFHQLTDLVNLVTDLPFKYLILCH